MQRAAGLGSGCSHLHVQGGIVDAWVGMVSLEVLTTVVCPACRIVACRALSTLVAAARARAGGQYRQQPTAGSNQVQYATSRLWALTCHGVADIEEALCTGSHQLVGSNALHTAGHGTRKTVGGGDARDGDQQVSASATAEPCTAVPCID